MSILAGIPSWEHFSLSNQRVLIRLDLNTPMQKGRITSDARIRAALPTIRSAVEQNAKVLLMSHLGRPQEGQYCLDSSLAPVAEALGEQLGQSVRLITDYLGVERGDLGVAAGEVVLLENVRFNVGEKADDESLARRYARLCDLYVMNAFATAHRAQASTHGVGRYAPQACAGPLLLEELAALDKAWRQPARPLVAIVGGAKVSSKLMVLESLAARVDHLIVGGGIANTFLAAAGEKVGDSLYEPNLCSQASELLRVARAAGGDIPLPRDVVTGRSFDASTPAVQKSLAELEGGDLILDIGPETAADYTKIIQTAGTIIWNGPVGVFEFPAFAAGTKALANAIASSAAFSIAGGGDTLAAIEKFSVGEQISYISTGGGACLEFFAGAKLPAVEMLKRVPSSS